MERVFGGSLRDCASDDVAMTKTNVTLMAGRLSARVCPSSP